MSLSEGLKLFNGALVSVSSEWVGVSGGNIKIARVEKGNVFFHKLQMTHHGDRRRMLVFLISKGFQQLISSCIEE